MKKGLEFKYSRDPLKLDWLMDSGIKDSSMYKVFYILHTDAKVYCISDDIDVMMSRFKDVILENGYASVQEIEALCDGSKDDECSLLRFRRDDDSRFRDTDYVIAVHADNWDLVKPLLNSTGYNYYNIGNYDFMKGGL